MIIAPFLYGALGVCPQNIWDNWFKRSIFNLVTFAHTCTQPKLYTSPRVYHRSFIPSTVTIVPQILYPMHHTKYILCFNCTRAPQVTSSHLPAERKKSRVARDQICTCYNEPIVYHCLHAAVLFTECHGKPYPTRIPVESNPALMCRYRLYI